MTKWGPMLVDGKFVHHTDRDTARCAPRTHLDPRARNPLAEQQPNASATLHAASAISFGGVYASFTNIAGYTRRSSLVKMALRPALMQCVLPMPGSRSRAS